MCMTLAQWKSRSTLIRWHVNAEWLLQEERITRRWNPGRPMQTSIQAMDIQERSMTPINPEQEALRGTRLRKLALADGAQSMIPRFINRRKREADINSFWIFHCHLPKRIFDDDGDIIFIARRKLVSCEFLITATADWIAPIGCTACSFTILLWYTWYFLLFHSALTDYFLPIFSGFWQQ